MWLFDFFFAKKNIQAGTAGIQVAKGAKGNLTIMPSPPPGWPAYLHHPSSSPQNIYMYIFYFLINLYIFLTYFCGQKEFFGWRGSIKIVRHQKGFFSSF